MFISLYAHSSCFIPPRSSNKRAYLAPLLFVHLARLQVGKRIAQALFEVVFAEEKLAIEFRVEELAKHPTTRLGQFEEVFETT